MVRGTSSGVTGGLRAGVAAAAVVLLAACGAPGPGDGSSPTPGPSGTPTRSPAETPAQTPTASPSPASVAPTSSAPAAALAPGSVPPSWLGTRVLDATASGYVAPQRTPRDLRQRRFTLPDTVAALPGRGFASEVVDPAPDDVVARSTWVPGCPVGRDDLAWVRLTFRGFDGARHTGELLVGSRAADDLVQVFRSLWRADFPLEEMRITTPAEQTAAPTGDGNDTGAFNCRAVRGATSYSQHASGLAVDVNPFQNPYEREGDEGRVVLPELATSYLDRDDVRPGMIEPDGPVVRAFAAVGWQWGGDYRSLKDYQHFSLTGG